MRKIMKTLKYECLSCKNFIQQYKEQKISKSAKGAFLQFKMEINSLHLIRNIQYFKKH